MWVGLAPWVSLWAANFDVANEAALAAAIGNLSDGDTITFTGDIALTAPLPVITKDVSLVGGAYLAGGTGANALRISGATVTLGIDLSDNDVSLENGASLSSAADFYHGGSISAELNISGGSEVVTTAQVFLGRDVSDVSNTTVTGAGSRISASVFLSVGAYGGTGHLQVLDGGRVESAKGFIGAAGGTGHVTVSGAGSVWESDASTAIGFQGSTGTLAIDNEGVVRALLFELDGHAALSIASGGVAEVGGVVASGTSVTVDFDGGILRARNGSGDFISGFAAGDVTINAGGAFLDTNGFNVTVAAPIDGVGALTKQGEGTLELTGTNTFNGLTITGGTVKVTSDANLGLANAAISLDGGVLDASALLAFSRPTTITANSGTFHVESGTLTHAGVISGAGALTKTGAGTLALTAANTYLGGTNVEGGWVAITASNNLGAAGTSVTLDSGGLQTSGTFSLSRPMTLETGGGGIDVTTGTLTQSGVISGGGGLRKDGAGTLVLTGANTFTGLTNITAGTLQIGAGATGSLAGDITNAGALVFNRSTDLTYAGNILGAGTLTKNGSGTVTLTGTLGYTGATTVNAGALEFAGNGVIATSSIDVNGGQVRFDGDASAGATSITTNTLGFAYFRGNASAGSAIITNNGVSFTSFEDNATADNATINLGADAFLEITGLTSAGISIGAIDGAGNVHLGDKTLTTGGTNASTTISGEIDGAGGALTKIGTGTLTLSGANTYTGATTVSDGVLRAGAANALAANSAHVVSGGATLDVFGFDQSIVSLAGAGTVRNGGASGATLTVGGGTSTTFSGGMEDGGAALALTKSGSGTLTLSGANTYTGATAVNAGRLNVTGSLGNTAVTVANGATLGGSGTIAGAVSIQSGGTIAAGNSPGTLTVGSLSLVAGSVLDYELGNPGGVAGVDSDLIVATGDVTLAGQLAITDVGGFGAGTYRLINYGGTLTNAGLVVSSLPAGFNPGALNLDVDTAGQVNLVVGSGTTQYWDGANTTSGLTAGGRGGNGTWNAAATNWTNAGGSLNGAWGAGTAIFGGTAGTVTLAANQTTDALQFETSGYTLEVGPAFTLTIASGGIGGAEAASATLTATGGAGDSVTNTDHGTIHLNGANTGGATITTTGGTGMNSDGVGGDAIVNFTGAATASSSTINNTGGTAVASGTGGRGIVTFTDDASAGSATIHNVGGAGATATGGAALLAFEENATAGMATIVNTGAATESMGAATVQFDDSSTAGDATITNTGSGGEFAPAARLIFNDSASAGAATIAAAGGSAANAVGASIEFNDDATASNATFTIGGGTTAGAAGGRLVFDGDASAGSATITINDGTNGGAAGTVSFLGNSTGGTASLTIHGAATLDIASNGGAGLSLGSLAGSGSVALGTKVLTVGGNDASTTFSGTIGATAGALVKIGTGTLILGGDALHTGGTTIDAGVLQIGAGGTTGSLAGDIVNHAELVFDRSDALMFAGDISGTGTLTKRGSGTLTLVGTNDATGGTTISAGTLRIGDGGTSGSLAGDITNAAALVFDRADDVTHAGAIGGTGTLTKAGAGTLTLSGTSSYTGATTVDAGQLNVTGSLGATAVTVANGATLGGTGSIGGVVTVEDGGRLAPGTSPGTLTIDSDLVLNAGSILDFEFGAPNVVGGGVNDLVIVSGALTLDGTLNVSAGVGYGAGVYRIFNFTGTLTNNGLELGALPAGFSYGVQTSVANQVNLLVDPAALQFWDGASSVADGVVDGGTGVWSGAGTNWTDADGAVAGPWTGQVGIFGGSAGTVTLADPLSFEGLQFMVTGYEIAGTGANTLTPTGTATLTTDAGVTATISAVLEGAGAVNKLGAGTLILSGDNAYTGGTTISAGTLQIGAGGTSGAIAGDITNDAALVFDRSDVFVFAGDIAGTGTLTKNGAGVLALTGDVTSTGGTTITAGTLQIGAGGTAGWLAGDVTNNATLRFNRSDDVTFTGAVSGTGELEKQGAGTLTLAGAYTATGGTTISAGTLQIGAGGATGSLAGDVSNEGALIFNRSDAMTFAGDISGAGSVTKLGAATLTLSGVNTYTGATKVSAGRLDVVGSLGATAVTVANGATLGGTGTISGSVSVQAGGRLAPGTSPGTLTVGSLSLVGGSILDFELGTPDVVGGATNDLIVVTGDLTLDGLLSVTAGAGFGTGVYRLINYGGALIDNGLELDAMPGGFSFGVQTSVANQVNLLVNATAIQFWDGANTGPDGAIDGGAGTWNAAATNWTSESGNANAAWGGRTAVFGGTAGTVTLGEPVSFEGLQFTMDGYTIAGGGANVLRPTGVASIRTDADVTATMAAALSGGGGVLKEGAGRLILTGENDYTGGTTIAGGTLQIGDGTTAGSIVGDVTNNAALVFDNGESDATVFGGVISGTGTVAKQGAGTLTLTGANTYTGGTIIAAGTLRIGDGGTSGAIAGDVSNDGVLAFDRSDAVTFAGTVTGTGALVQMGNARLTLTGDHSYTGGTTVGAGGLQIGAGGTTGWIQGDVVANGVLAFNRSNDVVFDGAVSGTGELHQVGAGKLTLTGENALAGGATVAEGSTLQIGDGGMSGSFSGPIANIGTLIFHRADAIVHEGVISGSGTLTKRGAGVLTLSGANTFTGLTRVDAGTLMLASGSSVASAEVAAGAVLGGGGTVRGNLINRGTVSPGFSPGVLSVTGNFVQHSGGKLVIEVASAASFDRLVVGGTATLDGTLEVVVANGFTFEAGQTWEVISAGSVSGRFGEVISPFTNLPLAVKFDTIYDADSVALAFVQVPYASFATTPNQAEVGRGLNEATESGEAPTLRDEFNRYTDVADIREGLSQLSPLRYQRWFDAALFNTGALVRAVEDQIGGGRAAGRHAWAEVVRREADFGGDADVVAAELETNGIVAGVDHANDAGIALGGLFSYETTRIDAASGGGRTRVETFTPALYARHAAGAWSSEAVVGYAWHDYDAVRTVALANLPRVARGETDGTQRFASVRTSYAMKAGELAVTPFAGVQHVRWEADELVETGAGDASLKVAAQRGESLASRVGVRLALPFQAGGWWITPQIEGTWRHEFQQSRRHLAAAIGGSSFTVRGRAPSEDGWIAAFGFDVRLRDTLSVYARVTRESDGAAERSTDLRAGASYRF